MIMSEKQNYSMVTFSPDPEVHERLTAFAAANNFTLDEAVTFILKEMYNKGE